MEVILKKTLYISLLILLFLPASGKEQRKRVLRPYTFVNGLEKVDFSKTLIDLKELYAGCPKTDCIPALNDPGFVSIKDSKIGDDTMGIIVTHKGVTKYYPYNILVWHEIVNDSIDDLHYVVSFCPLCGTGMVFNRQVGDEILKFGVSGTLLNSNLVMYDKNSYSLWPQSQGRCAVGKNMGKELKLIDMQLVSFSELKKQFPNSMVLSTDTGFKRDYSRYPYGNYNLIDRIMFPVHEINKDFPVKELFYVFKVEGKSVAVRISKFDDSIYKKKINGKEYKLTKLGGVVFVMSPEGLIPGYYEMWFSFYSTHGKKGIVWEK